MISLKEVPPTTRPDHQPPKEPNIDNKKIVLVVDYDQDNGILVYEGLRFFLPNDFVVEFANHRGVKAMVSELQPDFIVTELFGNHDTLMRSITDSLHSPNSSKIILATNISSPDVNLDNYPKVSSAVHKEQDHWLQDLADTINPPNNH